MLHDIIKPFLIFFFLVLMGCATSGINNSGTESSGIIIENVPFIKQKYRFCGPAALTSVMRYYGQDIDQETVAENVYTPELKGSLISDMKHYAVESGFSASTENGDLEQLMLLIDQKKPVILLVDKGKLGVKVQHYYVAYGYNPERNSFTVHDGKKSGREISYIKLNREWEKMNWLMLVIDNEN